MVTSCGKIIFHHNHTDLTFEHCSIQHKYTANQPKLIINSTRSLHTANDLNLISQRWLLQISSHGSFNAHPGHEPWPAGGQRGSYTVPRNVDRRGCLGEGGPGGDRWRWPVQGLLRGQSRWFYEWDLQAAVRGWPVLRGTAGRDAVPVCGGEGIFVWGLRERCLSCWVFITDCIQHQGRQSTLPHSAAAESVWIFHVSWILK